MEVSRRTFPSSGLQAYLGRVTSISGSSFRQLITAEMESSVAVMQSMQALLQWKLPPSQFEASLTAAANLSVDGVRFMLAFFASIAAGLLLRHTPTVLGRQAVSVLTGVALCAYVFGGGVLHGAVVVVLNWAAFSLAPRHAAASAWLLNFPYLAACHVAGGDTWKRGDLDFTGAMMIIFLKMVSLGTNLADGSRGRTDVSEYLRERALHVAPGLWELFAYTFSNGSLLGGPYFEFGEWDDFVRRRGVFREAFYRVDGRTPPSCVGPAMSKVAAACACLAMYVALSPYFPLGVILSPSFDASPLWLKFVKAWCIGLVFRMKFYFVWTLSDANLTLAGFGFNGWEDEARQVAKWDRQTNGLPLKIETADSVATLMHWWNCRTSVFLRRYVYEKATFGAKRPGFAALFITNIVSALWHGVRATFVLMFATAAVMVEVSRFIHVQEKRLPDMVWQSLPWRCLKILWTATVMNYTCLAFHFYDVTRVLVIWQKFYYLPHIVLGVAMLCHATMPRPRKKAGRSKSE